VKGDVGVLGFVISSGGVFGLSEFFPRGLLILLQLFIMGIFLFCFPVGSDIFLKLRNLFLPGIDFVYTVLIAVVSICDCPCLLRQFFISGNAHYRGCQNGIL
jgi:hypothetical protein